MIGWIDFNSEELIRKSNKKILKSHILSGKIKKMNLFSVLSPYSYSPVMVAIIFLAPP